MGSPDQEVAEYLTWMAASGQSQSDIAAVREAYRTAGMQGFDAKEAAITGRRYDEAIERYRNILRRDPNCAAAHRYLSFAYRDTGSPDQEVAEHLVWMAASGQSPSDIAALREAYRTAGTQGFDAKHAELAGLAPPVRWYLRRGDKDGAFAKLERQFAQRNPTLPFLKVNRGYDPLRSDPRYSDLLRRMALE